MPSRFLFRSQPYSELLRITMRFLSTIIRMYPRRSALTLIALLFASVAEGVGLLFLLPMLSMATGEKTFGTGVIPSGAQRILTQALSVVGLRPTVGTLLVVIVLCVVAKGVFLLLAKTQVAIRLHTLPLNCDSRCSKLCWPLGGSITYANLSEASLMP